MGIPTLEFLCNQAENIERLKSRNELKIRSLKAENAHLQDRLNEINGQIDRILKPSDINIEAFHEWQRAQMERNYK